MVIFAYCKCTAHTRFVCINVREKKIIISTRVCVCVRLIIVCKNLPGPSSAEILLCSFNYYRVINTQ